ncbi:DUF1292 domain-containing protein [bacterium]|nr:DUF1292 domain-containing protein [bacterium]
MPNEEELKENEERQLIETVDEDGNIINFELFDIVEFEEKEYALLLPADEKENDETDEIVLMRLLKEGDDYTFEAIDDDEEFDKVSSYIESIENEDEEEEEEE